MGSRGCEDSFCESSPLNSDKFISDECRNIEYDVVEPEVAASVIRPYFDAVRDTFASFVPVPSCGPMAKLADVVFVVNEKRHDTPRHFAACRNDGKQLEFAPQFVELPVATMVAILAHEFGHAADFAYPAHWRIQPGGPGLAEWIGDPQESKWGRNWAKSWESRSPDQVEWTADGIATVVTGRSIGYCGPCTLQCFDQGILRPKGLR